MCPQPWDLALVLEFSDGTLRPEDFGARPGMDRFVMEVRACFVSQKPDVTYKRLSYKITSCAKKTFQVHTLVSHSRGTVLGPHRPLQ